MAKQYYKVANLLFSIEIVDDEKLSGILSNYTPFEISLDQLDDSMIKSSLLFELIVKGWDNEVEEFVQYDKTTIPTLKYDEEDKIITIYKSGDRDPLKNKFVGDYRFHFFNKLSKYDNLGVLKINDNFKETILNVKGTLLARQFALNNSVMMLFAFTGANHKALLQHASVIKLNGKGYSFLGVSGTGKSTHSQLWLNNIENSELLNDDNPVIRLDNKNVPYVFGSPWSGKTPCYKNDSALLGGFVNLKQAPHNKIRKLSPIESYAVLLPTFSNLKWERYVADGLNSTVEELLKSTNIYELECLPDAEAALLSHRTLLEGNEDIGPNANSEKGANINGEKRETGEAKDAKESKRSEKSKGGENRGETAEGYKIFDYVDEFVREGFDQDGNGKKVTLRVRGNSMLPFIFNGRDSVTLKKQDSYKVGDIVLAKYLNRYVLHRIWSFEGDNVILHGDGNRLSLKEEMPVTNIVAKVVEIIYNGKSKNPDAPWQKFKYKVWHYLLPFRRVFLGIYRRLPYYKKYTKIQQQEDKKRAEERMQRVRSEERK